MPDNSELNRLSRFFETSSDLMCMADPTGAFLRTNPAFTETLGYSEAELLSKPFVDFVVPEDRQATIDEMASQMKKGFSFNFENRYICKDGSVKWLSWRAVYDRSEGITYAIARDITSRKNEEEELRRVNSFVSLIIETLPNMLFLKDAKELRFVEFNRAGEELLGYSKADLMGKNDYDFFPKDQADFFTSKDREVLGGTGVVDIPEERLETRFKGTRILHTKKVGLFNARGEPEYLLGISEDITGQKEMESQKTRLQLQLQQSQKLESLGSLAGGIAHDMNNVLGAILGLASANLTTQPEGSSLFRTFETIAKAAERGGAMVKNLLSFARQNPVENRPLSVNEILREEARLLERTTLAKVRLVLELAPDLRPIMGDAGALSHAFMNLCVNAVEAIPDQGSLTLRTRNRGESEIEVTVEDNGTGMSQEVLDKALDPFFTTKSTGKGTGLGLSIVYSTVRAHNGRMEIQSQSGRGTVVTLWLPACTTPPAKEVAVPPHPEPRFTSLNVLLVDDDELIQSSMGELLQVLGHRVTTVGTGELALARVDAGLQPDLVILDMNMPGLGGAGTLPRLKNRCPAVPVLLTTGRADQNAHDLAAAFSGVTLLPKPFSLEELEEALNF